MKDDKTKLNYSTPLPTKFNTFRYGGGGDVPSRNLLHWLSRIIAVSGQIITKIWLWGLISDHILSSNKTNCVRDHKKSNYWANFLIIQWLFMILVIIQWLSWLFSDNWWLFMIIQHESWLFTANQVSPWNDGR